MEQIIFIKNNDIGSVNQLLRDGWIVKHISSTCENITIDGSPYYKDKVGNVFAYIVLEKI